MKLTNAMPSAYHRCLLAGLPGSGKSTLVAELSKSFKLIWIDLENGLDVLLKLPTAQQENITYIGIPDSASFPIAAQSLMTLFKTGKANICEAHGKHECALCKKDSLPFEYLDFSALTPDVIVVVDSITQLSQSILSYTMKDKPVDYKPERDDWGALRKYTEFFASQFQAFPGNLICMAQVLETTLEDGKTKLVPVFGSAGMSAAVAKNFGDVIYLEIKNKKHFAYSASTASNNFLTRSRSDFMIESLEVPSLLPLFSKSKIPEKKVVTPAQTALNNLKALRKG